MFKRTVNKRIFKNTAICFFLWILGFFIAFSLFQHHYSESVRHGFNLARSYYFFGTRTIMLFSKIFLTNTVVALLLSIGGYFSGGLLSVIISLWNGVKLGMIVGQALFHLSLISLLLAFIHGPFEIVALCWFGGIGMLGFWNVKRIWNNKKPVLISFPGYKKFVPPLVLLFGSAIIETSLFVIYS